MHKGTHSFENTESGWKKLVSIWILVLVRLNTQARVLTVSSRFVSLPDSGAVGIWGLGGMDRMERPTLDLALFSGIASASLGSRRLLKKRVCLHHVCSLVCTFLSWFISASICSIGADTSLESGQGTHRSRTLERRY